MDLRFLSGNLIFMADKTSAVGTTNPGTVGKVAKTAAATPATATTPNDNLIGILQVDG
jgi:hypothetical protein